MVVHWQVLRKISTKIFLDRKSTRLNSSHLGISYAVFCLKKKNNLSFFRWYDSSGRNIYVCFFCCLPCYIFVGDSQFQYYSFFFNDTATTEIYTLSLHDALPI